MPLNSFPHSNKENVDSFSTPRQIPNQNCSGSTNERAGGYAQRRNASATREPYLQHPTEQRLLSASIGHSQPGQQLRHSTPASKIGAGNQGRTTVPLDSPQPQPSSRGHTPRRVHSNGFQYSPHTAAGSGRGLPPPSFSSDLPDSNGVSHTSSHATDEGRGINERDKHTRDRISNGPLPRGGAVMQGGELNGVDAENNDVGARGRSYQVGQSESESTTWAIRATKAVQPMRHRAYKPMTDAERLSSQARTEQAGEEARLLNEAVAEVQNYCKMKAEEIAQRFHKKPNYVHRLIHSATLFKQTRNPNLFNALVHKKAREVNSNCSSGDRVSLSGIQHLVLDELQERHPTKEEADSAVKELQDHRDLKKKGARATNLAAAHDLKTTLIRLDTELNNLHERTGSYALALVTRGHVHDFGIPGWAASVDAKLFVQDVLKMDIWDLLKKFELWAVTRDIRPNIDTLLTMRTECSSLITEGLRSITKNKKITMNYANYDRSIIQKYHVKLDGWPPTIPFSTPHSICTVDEICLLRHQLIEKRCRWIRLADADVREHMDAYTAKVQNGVIASRKRKVRSDKGKPRKKRASTAEDVDEEVECEEEAGDEGREDHGPRRSRRPTKGKHRSMAFIDDEADDGEGGTSDEYAEDDT